MFSDEGSKGLFEPFERVEYPFQSPNDSSAIGSFSYPYVVGKEENVFEKLKIINPVLYHLFESCVEKIISKNNDYAGKEDFYKNFRDSEEIDIPAWKAIWIRFGDKRRRIVNFIKNKGVMAVKDESFRDTCIDGANYLLLMLACYLDGEYDTKKVS